MNKKLTYELDGNMWCCRDEYFTNLQESIAGFGETKEEAKEDYLKQKQ